MAEGGPEGAEWRVDLLKDSQRRTTAVQWPTEVDDHLDHLVRLLAAEGIQISRAQLLAALVADANPNGTSLARVARRYLGRMQVGDLAAIAPEAGRLPSTARRGRRRRSAT